MSLCVDVCACTYMSPCHFNSCIPVNIAEKPQTEAFRVGGVCESIYCEGGLGGMEGLSYTLVQLIVRDRAPEGRLAVCHRLQVCVSRGWGLEGETLIDMHAPVRSMKKELRSS